MSSLTQLRSEFLHLQKMGAPSNFCLQLQSICDRFGDRELTDRWVNLVELRRFNLPLAKKTLLIRRELVEKMNPRSIDSILNHIDKLPSIGSVRHYRGQKNTVSWVGSIINLVDRSINLVRPITADQVDIAANILIDKYSFLNLADIKYLVINGIAGRYGKVLDRFDVNVFFTWVDQYCEERHTVAEHRKIRTHDQIKKSEEYLSGQDYERGKIERIKELINK